MVPTLLANTGASGGSRSGMVSQGWARDRTSHQGHGYPVASCGKPAQPPKQTILIRAHGVPVRMGLTDNQG